MIPRITVITVCRNARALLEPTVRSVLEQEMPGLEYWVIDGASTDGTREYLEELAAIGVRTLSERDHGIADAMNKGVARAAGEYVAHLHAGDRYLPGALAAVAARLEAEPETDVMCGWLVKREERGDTIYRCDPGRLPWDMTVNHPATWTRRSVFERLGGFEAAYPNAMDYEFFLRLHAAGCRFAVIEEPLAFMTNAGQSERSLWATLSETQAIRRRHVRSGFARSGAYLALLYARGAVRRALQRMGLGGLVDLFRRRFALVRKESAPPAP